MSPSLCIVCWCGTSLHESEYKVDMLWWTPGVPPLSRSRWASLRAVGLLELSIVWLGPKSAAEPGAPSVLLRLVQKVSKSNFGM